jgi:hypothetical protein
MHLGGRLQVALWNAEGARRCIRAPSSALYGGCCTAECDPGTAVHASAYACLLHAPVSDVASDVQRQGMETPAICYPALLLFLEGRSVTR